MPYTIVCLVEGDNSQPFPVDIDKDRLIGHLKKSIKEEKNIYFKDIDSDQLLLWQVDTPDDQEINFADLKPGAELKPTRRVRRYWESEPSEDHIHIAVKLPSRQ